MWLIFRTVFFLIISLFPFIFLGINKRIDTYSCLNFAKGFYCHYDYYSCSRQQQLDYDSWGEEDDDDYEEDEENPAEYTNRGVRGGGGVSKRRYKPQPYASPVQTYSNLPQVVYGAPFPVYYPPPPRGSKGAKKIQARRQEK